MVSYFVLIVYIFIKLLLVIPQNDHILFYDVLVLSLNKRML